MLRYSGRQLEGCRETGLPCELRAVHQPSDLHLWMLHLSLPLTVANEVIVNAHQFLARFHTVGAVKLRHSDRSTKRRPRSNQSHPKTKRCCKLHVKSKSDGSFARSPRTQNNDSFTDGERGHARFRLKMRTSFEKNEWFGPHAPPLRTARRASLTWMEALSVDTRRRSGKNQSRDPLVSTRQCPTVSKVSARVVHRRQNLGGTLVLPPGLRGCRTAGEVPNPRP